MKANKKIMELISPTEEEIKNKSADKSIPLNFIINNDDLEFLDLISSEYGIKRAKIISLILSRKIRDMLLLLKDKEHIANYVDSQISKQGYSHVFKGRTWYWETSQQDANIYNPITQSDWLLIKENLKR